MFVDFGGDTIDTFDPITGEAHAMKLFVVAMGASSCTYAEACPSERLPDWIGVHTNLFSFLGGVPKFVVCDNPKAAVTNPDRYDPISTEPCRDGEPLRHRHPRSAAEDNDDLPHDGGDDELRRLSPLSQGLGIGRNATIVGDCDHRGHVERLAHHGAPAGNMPWKRSLSGIVGDGRQTDDTCDLSLPHHPQYRCSPPPPRTSRRSPWYSFPSRPPGPPEADAHLTNPPDNRKPKARQQDAKNPAENRRGLSAVKAAFAAFLLFSVRSARARKKPVWPAQT